MEIVDSRVAIVVPSNRVDEMWKFKSEWESEHATIFCVWDKETKPGRFTDSKTFRSISHREIKEQYGEVSKIFSTNDGGIRIAGFLEAARAGAEVIIVLDDDTRPHGSVADFIEGHCQNLRGGFPRWISSAPGIHQRGLPYLPDIKIQRPVLLSVGLWQGVPDVDTIETFAALRRKISLHYIPPKGTRIVPAGQLVTLSGMNFAFPVEFLPAAFWPKQSLETFQRFDDIWGGFSMQLIIEQFGGIVTTGEPFVLHERRSSAYANLKKETRGIIAHDEVSQLIDGFESQETSIARTAFAFVEHLRRKAGMMDSDVAEYVKQWATDFEAWLELCKKLFQKLSKKE